MHGEAKSKLKGQKVTTSFVGPGPHAVLIFGGLRASSGIASVFLVFPQPSRNDPRGLWRVLEGLGRFLRVLGGFEALKVLEGFERFCRVLAGLGRF